MKKRFRLGTRESVLALAQAELVKAALCTRFPEIDVEIIKRTTTGDKHLSASLASFGGKGAFVSEFEQALQRGELDLAVHSAKDLPVALADGLEVAMVLPREDARDVLVWRSEAVQASSLAGTALAAGAGGIMSDGVSGSADALGTQVVRAPVCIGTSSLRRELQIKALLPHSECKLLRGNVPTRLAKLAAGDYDAIVLAAAGLKRLGLYGAAASSGGAVAESAAAGLIFQPLSYTELVPAGGQGIIAVECRSADSDTKQLLAACNDSATFAQFAVERYLLSCLNAGCQAPTAVFSQLAAGAGGEGAAPVVATLTIIEERNEKPRRRELSGAVGTAESLFAGDYRKLYALADALLAQGDAHE